ncbi:MAG TPA: hypothetical protein VE732_02955 [Nitrososphaera sp.]|jgi:hypothetical protein|nr:hypothetical protein [Nitrososphaera sp.]
MNKTMNQTTITVSVTRATSKNAIKKRVEFDRFGRQHVVETVRGIRI